MSCFRTFEGFCLSPTSCSGLTSSHVCVFGFECKFIHGTTVKHAEGNRIEKRFNLTSVSGGAIAYAWCRVLC